MPNRFLRLCLASAGVLAIATASRAISVIAPSFGELVASADVVVRGVVTDVHPAAVDTSQGPAIRTLVTLRVERTLKGRAGSEVTLSLLGGKLGKRTLTVVGMPSFHVGERQIVFFANNGGAICPLIAAGHGRFHVRQDASTGREYVTRDNGAPLVSIQDLTEPLESGIPVAPATRALSLPAFENQVLAAVGAPGSLLQP